MNEEQEEQPEAESNDEFLAQAESAVELELHEQVEAPAAAIETPTPIITEVGGEMLPALADELFDADGPTDEADEVILDGNFAEEPEEAFEEDLSPEALAEKRQSERHFMAALIFFLSAIVLGSLLTSLPSMSAGSWPVWVWLRILAQVGGGAWFGYAMARMMNLGRWQIAVVFMLFGAFISLNALIDGVRGPQIVEGTVEQFRTESNYLHDQFGWQSGIRAEIELAASDGSEIVLRPAGAQIANYAEVIRRCNELDHPIQFRMLERLEIILEARCFISI